jgi:hypothetical protein
MTNFLGNLARRGAGLAISIAPRQAPPAMPDMSRDTRPRSSVGVDVDGDSEGRVSSAPRSARERPASSPSDPAIEATPIAVRRQAKPALTFPEARAEARETDRSPEKSAVVRPAGALLNRREDAVEQSARPMQRRLDAPQNQEARDQLPAITAGALKAEYQPVTLASRRHNSGDTEPLSVRPRAEMQPAREAASVRPAPPLSSPPTSARATPPTRTAGEPRGASVAAAPAAPTEVPNVQVRIGKIEIRASQTASPPPRPVRPASRGFTELALARAHLNRNYR